MSSGGGGTNPDDNCRDIPRTQHGGRAGGDPEPLSEELHRLAEAGAWIPGDSSEPNAIRRKTLEHFLSEGATVEQLETAVAEHRLHSFGADRLVETVGELTSLDMANRLGIGVDQFERVIRTAGLHVPDRDAIVFSESDANNIGALLPALELFPMDVALQLLRVIGSSLARIADASVGAYLQVIERGIVESGGTELDHAYASRDALDALANAMGALDGLLSRHLALAIDRSRQARADGDPFDTLYLAVGFVDLVGYTSLSGRLTKTELAKLIFDFEETAYDAVSAHHGRVVKLIGDEVMYVTVGGAAAVDVALTLVEAFEHNERTTPRGGVAVGHLLFQEGDYYGPVVNLASRIADLAVPSEILVNDVVHDELAEHASGFELEGAGKRLLKGFGSPIRLWSVTRDES